MLSVVGKLVALVDSSKIGERAGMLFSRADQIAMLITGKNANPQVLQQLEARCKHTPRLKMLSEKRYRRRQRFWRNAMPHACGP